MANINKDSARNRWKLLSKVISNPKILTRPISDACQSQGAMAAFEMPKEGISRMTLNTLRTRAILEIESEDGTNGWSLLEEKRLQVLSLVKHVSQVKHAAPRKTLDEQIAALEQELDKSNRQRLRLERGYYELLSMLRPLALRDTALNAKLKRQLATFSIKNLSVIKGGKNGGQK